jgi:hypothetical protein
VRQYASPFTLENKRTAGIQTTARGSVLLWTMSSLKVLVAAQFDKFAFLIVFPLKPEGWGRAGFVPRAMAEFKVVGPEMEAAVEIKRS